MVSNFYALLLSTLSSNPSLVLSFYIFKGTVSKLATRWNYRGSHYILPDNDNTVGQWCPHLAPHMFLDINSQKSWPAELVVEASGSFTSRTFEDRGLGTTGSNDPWDPFELFRIHHQLLYPELIKVSSCYRSKAQLPSPLLKPTF